MKKFISILFLIIFALSACSTLNQPVPINNPATATTTAEIITGTTTSGDDTGSSTDEASLDLSQYPPENVQIYEIFKDYAFLDDLIMNGFNLESLLTVSTIDELRGCIEPYFFYDNGLPVDNHSLICYKNNGGYRIPMNTTKSMWIDFAPLINDPNIKNYSGYDGVECITKVLDLSKPENAFYYDLDRNYSWFSFEYIGEDELDFFEKSLSAINTAANSQDCCNPYKNVVFDLTGCRGGNTWYVNKILQYLKGYNVRNIYLIIDVGTGSGAEFFTLLCKNMYGEKVTLIGQPTNGCRRGGFVGNGPYIKYVDFCGTTLDFYLPNDECVESEYINKYGIKDIPPEGIGIAPDIYTKNYEESVNKVLHFLKSASDNYLAPNPIKKFNPENRINYLYYDHILNAYISIYEN